MSESFLKELLIRTLRDIDSRNASIQAQKELKNLLVTLGNDQINIPNTQEGLNQVGNFLDYLQSRFPELQFTPNNPSKLKKSR